MAATQYIGARYVPLFYTAPDGSNNWTAGVAYDPLTVVTDLNQSYTSKIPVPATVGRPSENPTYWILTGSYSAQVEEYRQEVAEVRENLEVIDTQVNQQKRTALYLGNSYANGSGAGGGIYDKTKALFDDSYLYADGGVGFVPYTGHTITFGNLLTRALNSGDFDAATITDVVIIGAWGETLARLELGASTWLTRFNAEAADLRTRITAAFPNLKRVQYTLAESRGIHNISTNQGVSTYSQPFQTHLLMKQRLGVLGYEYGGWIGWQIFMNSGFFNSDHYHPNANGYTVLGAAWISAYTGELQYIPRRSGFNLPAGFMTGSTMSGRVVMTPDTCDIQFNRVILKAGSTPAQYNHFDMLNFGNVTYMPAFCGVTDDTGVIHCGSYELICGWNGGTPDPTKMLLMRLDLKEDNSGGTYIDAHPYSSQTIADTTLNSVIINGGIHLRYGVD